MRYRDPQANARSQTSKALSADLPDFIELALAGDELPEYARQLVAVRFNYFQRKGAFELWCV